MLAEHAQGLRRMASYEYALAVRQEMTNEIRDRVTLASAWRPLHQYRAVPIQMLGNAELFLVGSLAEKNVSFTQNGRASRASIPARGFAADNIDEGLAEIIPRLNALYHLFNGFAVSLGPGAQV
jgi:hypothetical protein